MRSVKSKSWSNEEDQHLAQIVNQKIKNEKKLAWNQVAVEMTHKFQNFNKIGKQCRQRWTNHLNPAVKKNDEWTRQENEIMMTLHSNLGNRWSQISKHIPGRTDNCIKNHFNSLMRTGLRKINEYIRTVKRKTAMIKIFKNQLLDKVLALCQGKNDEKFQFEIEAKQLAEEIKTKFAMISWDKSEENMELKQNLFQQICEFKKRCRRRKTKKIGSEPESSSQFSEVKQKKKEKKKSQRFSQSYKLSSSYHPASQIKSPPAGEDEQPRESKQESEKKESCGVAAEALNQFAQQHKPFEFYPYPSSLFNSTKQEEPPGPLERSNQLSSSVLFGSKLLSSLSNLYPQKNNSGIFNFVPASQELEQHNIGFLSTVQDVSQPKKQLSQNKRGQFDFSNKPLQQFGQIFELGEIPMRYVFPSAFESPLHQQPLLGSIPYTNSSGFNFLSTNMAREEQEVKLKNLKSEMQQNQLQCSESGTVTKPISKSFSL